MNRAKIAERIVRASLKKKHLFSLPGDLIEDVARYQTALEIPSFEEAIEVLIRQALAATPEAAVVRHARIQAIEEATRWLKQRIASNLSELQHELMTG